jgi:hypothetical protein
VRKIDKEHIFHHIKVGSLSAMITFNNFRLSFWIRIFRVFFEGLTVMISLSSIVRL